MVRALFQGLTLFIIFGHSHSLGFTLLEAEAERKAQDSKGEKEDYKGDSKFASHLKTSSGVSSFARTRTLKEQREYLPAFACREELMKVIRENQGMSSLSLARDVYSPHSSCCRGGRNRFRKDHSACTIPLRGRILLIWPRWMYPASARGCYVCSQTCQRRDGGLFKQIMYWTMC
jgi:hypothetical protein